ncbi:hypothetical protein [Actinophytocola sp.]|uniref:hypothetical protein n=1 Tax=Actinophytocola sp. TaxID=1872138 RepID=UPI00389A2E05
MDRTLAAKDLRQVLDLLHAIHDNDTATTLPQPVFAAVAAPVGCESAVYIRLDAATPRVTVVGDEPADVDAGRSPAFSRVVGEHPLFRAYRAGRIVPHSSVALSDVANTRQLTGLRLYREFHEPVGIVEQFIGVVREDRPHVSALVFHRDRRVGCATVTGRCSTCFRTKSPKPNGTATALPAYRSSADTAPARRAPGPWHSHCWPISPRGT